MIGARAHIEAGGREAVTLDDDDFSAWYPAQAGRHWAGNAPAVGVPRMTIVVAMKETDWSVLIAADGEFTDDKGFKSRQRKLSLHSKNQLAWACDGPYHGGRVLGLWLSRADAYGTWHSFAEEAAGELAKVNRSLMLRAQAVGSWNPSQDRTSCLVAGFFGGEPQIIELGGDGHVDSHWESGFDAIGAGARFAVGAYEYSLRESPPALDALREIMRLVAERVPTCGGPIDIARITTEGAQFVETWTTEWKEAPAGREPTVTTVRTSRLSPGPG